MAYQHLLGTGDSHASQRRIGYFSVGSRICVNWLHRTQQHREGHRVGRLFGAEVGTAVGVASGDPRTGAVVGGLLAAGAGGWIGNDIDRDDKHRAADEAAGRAYDRAQPSRIDEIVRMAKNGQSERVIVNHIRQSRMRFLLNAEELNDLKANGVPDPVIVEMQNTAEPSPVIARELVASAAVDHRRAVRLGCRTHFV